MTAQISLTNEVISYTYIDCNVCGKSISSSDQKMKEIDQKCGKVSFSNLWTGEISEEKGLTLFDPSKKKFTVLNCRSYAITFPKDASEPEIKEYDHECASFDVDKEGLLGIEEIIDLWEKDGGVSFDFTRMTIKNCLEALVALSSKENIIISSEIIDHAKASLSGYLEFMESPFFISKENII